MLRLCASAVLGAAVVFITWGLAGRLGAGARAWTDGYLARTGADLDSVFLDLEPQALLALGGAASVLVMVCMVLLSGSAVLAAAAGAAALFLPRLLLSRVRARRTLAFDGQLPDVLTNVANSLRAGLSLPQALDAVRRGYPPPVSQEIGLALKEVSMGRDLEGAVDDMAARVGSREAEVLGAALGAVKGIGGNISDVLDRIAVTLRERQGIERKVRALTAQGRFQGIVIGLVPPLLLLVLSVVDPSMVRRLFLDPLGWGVLAAVVLFETVGVILLRRIMKIDI